MIVATDDDRVMKAVKNFGGEARMTSPDLKSGTDRVAAVALEIPAKFYVNVQGDEPMMNPDAIDLAVELAQKGRFELTTVMTPMKDPADLSNPAVVKVLADRTGQAIYFSRYGIPYSRGAAPAKDGDFACKRHVGLYVYSQQMLTRFSGLPKSAWEVGEMLEKLRALENGIPIGIVEADFRSVGVDTPEDLELVRKELKTNG